MIRRRFLAATGAAGLASALPFSAIARERPIRIVVPYAAGGPTDSMARLLQEPLQRSLDGIVIVENMAGAGGSIGAQNVLNAPADGNTLFLGNNGPSAVTPLLLTVSEADFGDFRSLSATLSLAMTLVVAVGTANRARKNGIS